jgi:hypothetical protein
MKFKTKIFFDNFAYYDRNHRCYYCGNIVEIIDKFGYCNCKDAELMENLNWSVRYENI